MTGPTFVAQRLANIEMRKRHSSGDNEPDLTGPGNKLQTSHADSDGFNHYTNRSVRIFRNGCIENLQLCSPAI